MMISVKLRQCTPADINAVTAINKVSLPENYSQAFFTELLNTTPESFMVAEVDGRVVGYIMCRVEHAFTGWLKTRLTARGHIISVAVMPEYRRSGIGRALVEAGLASVRKPRVSSCYLEVRVNNAAAIALYRRLGFDVTETVDEYYADGSSAYLMSKQFYALPAR
jgi:ribosomal-protein-alanine N-acetyltransferase